jgi:hypothetical protein
MTPINARFAIGSALLLTGCVGKIVSPPTDPAQLSIGVNGTHRLSANEYDNALGDLLLDTTNPGYAALPQDSTDPFDNDYLTQIASGALVDSTETLAIGAAQRAVQNPVVLASILPCAPQGPGDTACLTQFITTFGRRALRRPLSPAEVTAYGALQSYAVEAGDFNVGVQLVIQALLQDMNFLYRVEVGTPTHAPGVFQLTDFELASRLSFFFWGSTPPDWLLDQARQAQLHTADQLHAAALQLLADPHARTRMERFHALWLSYAQINQSPAMAAAMETESAALVDQVVFDQPGDYFNLFESTQTYVNAALAQQYGLPSPGPSGFGWVAYGASGRKGILSHGSVLAVGAKFGDTSPTRRGLFVRTHLMCQLIPPPPPNVNPDLAPTSATSPCKVDRYSSHAQGGCASCHDNMDPIGFGLENYDQNGAYRTTDTGLPQCPISGNGSVNGLGTFHGPDGLADLLTGSGKLEPCITLEVFRFAHGRQETLDDQPLLEGLTADFIQGGRRIDQLMLAVVSDPSFAFTKEE